MSAQLDIEKAFQSAASSINNRDAADAIAKKRGQTAADANAVRKNAFVHFVQETKCITTLNGQRYLTAEGWQYIAALFNLNVSVGVTTVDDKTSVDDGAHVATVMAAASLSNSNGDIVASGTMVASGNEEWLRDKPLHAIYGLAQTRAISRAVRNKFGWFASWCGFSSTPAEEMPAKRK